MELAEGNAREAADHLKKSLEEREDYCPALYQMGLIAKRKNNYIRAADYFKKGIQGTCYELLASHFQLGLVWVEMGEYARARAKFREIVEKFPNSEYTALVDRQLSKLKRVRKKRDASKKEDSLVEEIPGPVSF